MARIRTVKPELFRHEGLFELEQRTNLPIRLFFIGLFTVADKEGRFEWRPKRIKLDILPYDNATRGQTVTDPSLGSDEVERVLNALVEDHFVTRYEVNGRWYGAIPTWHDHQRVRADEAPSQIPAPGTKSTSNEPKSLTTHSVSDGSVTRQTRKAPVEMEVEVEVERISKGHFTNDLQNDLTQMTRVTRRSKKTNDPNDPIYKKPFDLLAAYSKYPKKVGKSDGLKMAKREITTPHLYQQFLEAIDRYSGVCSAEGREARFVKAFDSFVSCWRDWSEPDAGASSIDNVVNLQKHEVKSAL